MKIDLAIIQSYVDERWISKQRHPMDPLLIWNYTQNTQFANKWDEYTSMCRGLITDPEGNVVQRCMPKFFNLGQGEENQIENLPAEVPEVTVKMDGSLGIMYWASDGLAMATRGSFTSDQAQWATKYLRAREWALKPWRRGYSYLYEILFPSNRIVVNYGNREDLVLLAVINVADGSELDHVAEARRLGLSYAGKVAGSPTELLAQCQLLPADEEGFVCRYSNGKRIKLKGAEYVRLHRIVTQCSARRVWECLSEGTPLEVWLDRVPDELFQWARDTEKDLLSRFNGLKVAANIAWRSVQDLPTRKDQALALQKSHKDVMNLAFSLMDGKPIDEAIWKRLRPAHELPYKVVVE